MGNTTSKQPVPVYPSKQPDKITPIIAVPPPQVLPNENILTVTVDISNKPGNTWNFNKFVGRNSNYIIAGYIVLLTNQPIISELSVLTISLDNVKTKQTIKTQFSCLGLTTYRKYLIPIKFGDSDKPLSGLTKIYIDLVTDKSENGPIYIKTDSYITVAHVPLDTKSTFGSMSSFGETCGCWTWIIMLILVLAIVGYILYQNRATIKIPGLPQRIAQFGRQIKTIKRM